MDFRTLLYFVTVAEEQNFTHAAEKLNMSQPPLSNQIRQLEDDLGVQLFIRGRRKVELTEQGEILLKRARQILSLRDKTREELTDVSSELTGHISIGIVEGRAPFLAARWIAAYRESHPGIVFDLWNGSSDDVLDQLDKGLMDLAVIAAPFDNVKWDGIKAAINPWVAMIPASHPLAKPDGDYVDLISLSNEPIGVPARQSRRQSLIRWFESVGAEANIVCTLSSYANAVALAEQNACISIFPQTTYTPNSLVVTKLITNPAKIAEYYVLWKKSDPPAGITKNFLQFVKEFIDQDMMHSEKYKIKEKEFIIPEGADML